MSQPKHPLLVQLEQSLGRVATFDEVEELAQEQAYIATCELVGPNSPDYDNVYERELDKLATLLGL